MKQAAWIEIINFPPPNFKKGEKKKFSCESNLRTFNEISSSGFYREAWALRWQKIDLICFIQQPCSHAFIRRENLVSKLQKVLNCYLISCCFSMYAARQKWEGMRGEVMKKLSEIHAGSQGKETMGKASYDGKQKWN